MISISVQELPLSQLTALPRADSRYQVPVHARGKTKAASDEKQIMLQSALRDSGRRELKQVRVEVRDSAVTLRGQVSSFYLKQVAQEVIRPLAIGLQIKNRLHVT